MSKTSTTPSAIARSVAASMWPDVQSQKKIAKGTFAFSCSGHGGLVAVVGEADFTPEAIAAARKAGLIHLVMVSQAGRRSRTYCTAAGYSADILRSYESQPGVTFHEVWIGEEDCEWATLAFASDSVRESMHKAGYSTEITRDYARDTCVRWGNADFVEALGA